MKALTIRQPHASLVAVGAKTIETRGWPTKYRGELLIHAGKARPETDDYEDGCEYGTLGDERWGFQWAKRIGEPDSWHYYANGDGPHPLPLGAVVASCRLVDCVPTDSIEWFAVVANEWETPVAWSVTSAGGAWVMRAQEPFGDFSPGRYALLLEEVRALPTPIPCRGKQGLWSPSDELLAEVERGFQEGGEVL